jgi:uncharacterized membrane protein YqgA involved in biofilm formation
VGVRDDQPALLRRTTHHLGSLQDGVSGDDRFLALKSALDFVASLSFASALGWGVLFLGLGLVFLNFKEMHVANMLPALLIVPLLVTAAPLWPLLLTYARATEIL